jgi:hypothetical protein
MVRVCVCCLILLILTRSQVRTVGYGQHEWYLSRSGCEAENFLSFHNCGVTIWLKKTVHLQSYRHAQAKLTLESNFPKSCKVYHMLMITGG